MLLRADTPATRIRLVPAFKAPDFNERTAAARAAKQRALEQLRSKPAPDPAVAAERQAARQAREAAEVERRAAKLAAAEQANAAEEEARAAEEQARAAAGAAARAEAEAATEAAAEAARAKLPKLPTAAELKAARDVRYAARKARK